MTEARRRRTPKPGKSGYAPPPPAARGAHARTRVALLATRWNTDLIDALLDGARRALADQGVKAARISEHRVPGAFELPLGAEFLARQGKVDGVVALGTVIRGGTPHFEYVCRACTDGLREVSLRHALPVGFGVLTVDTAAQARARAGRGDDNKGYEAAMAVLEMVRLGQSLGQ